MYCEIRNCRMCGGTDLDLLLELGDQYLTGVFPRTRTSSLTRGPLSLIRCALCGLVQLRHSYERTELYGAHYGYRSALNAMMVEHLREKAEALRQRLGLGAGDVVVDIGSNDGTFLSFFGGRGLRLVGFDPSAERWRDGYAPDAALVADFFSASAAAGLLGTRKAKLVTSIAMFYDLERPLEFAEAVADILADDGVWHLEQSYLPTMLRMNAYDTICHEHLEYYALEQIRWVADKTGLTVLDVAMNDVNGGSFAITLAKGLASMPAEEARVERCFRAEGSLAMGSLAPFRAFASRVATHRTGLLDALEDIRARKETVLGYGASTKGNVILQYAGVDARLLPAIAEVNADKFGCVTPGTWIPIISEAEARARKPDYFLVLPWHFRSGLMRREAQYLAAGGRLIFPLPEIDVVTA